MRAQSGAMTTTGETTGEAIARRRKAIGYDLAPFAVEAGVSRETLSKVERGAGARDKTLAKIMRALERLEAETGLDVPQAPAADGRIVTFEARGVFGVAEVSVAGPVENAEELAQKFADLITRLARDAGGE